MTRYSGLYTPVDGTFAQVAQIAALVFDAAIVTVNIADDARVWFPPTEGPDDGGTLPATPSLSAGLVQDPDVHTANTGTGSVSGDDAVLNAPYAIPDTSRDPRTRDHPWTRGERPVRFLALAPILALDGRRMGTLEVMDRRRRRSVSAQQLQLLGAMAATLAQLLHLRIASVATLRAERAQHAAQDLARDTADQVSAQMSQADTAARDRLRPDLCQLGGTQPCTEPAELKVADSWGQGAWGCWLHAEEVLVQIPSVFLATESFPNLATYQPRAVGRGPSPQA